MDQALPEPPLMTGLDRLLWLALHGSLPACYRHASSALNGWKFGP